MITKFQSKVYKFCSKIPRGKVSTYKEIAKAINHPKSYRAVGNALNKNPFSPKVPCHRVISSDGFMGGFARGNKEKIKMLIDEGVEIEMNKIVGYNKILYKFR